MKRIFIAITIFTSFAASNQTNAQNIPMEGATPTGSSAGIALPLNYNSGGNTLTTEFNFSRNWIPFKANTAFNPVGATMSTTYTNGFGQPLQTNVDLVHDQVTVYDNRSMLDKPSYLPYVHTTRGAKFRPDAFTEQKAWYNANFGNEGDNAYSRTQSVISGTQRSAVSYISGKSFTGSDRGTTVSMETNAWADGIWILQDNANGPVPFAHYQADKLFVKKVEGQHSLLSYEYTNRNGQLVCKKVDAGTGTPHFLTTYHVYNDLGKITWILPPKAVAALDASNWSGSLGAIYSGLCYHYVYNKDGQVIEKTAPDKDGQEYTVYDVKHRAVLSQTPLLADPTHNQWAFQVYDSRSRVVFSGFVNSTRSRQDWQDIADGTNTTNFAAGSLEAYLQHECNTTYPTTVTNCEINQYTYYDSYDFDPSLPFHGKTYSTMHNSDFSVSAFVVTPQPVSFVRGLPTATRTRVVGSTNPFAGEWTSSVVFYDIEGRPIQTQTLYPWSNGNDWDISSLQYNFRGQIVKSILNHKSLPNCPKTAGTKMLVTRAYETEGLGRLLTVSLSLDGGTPVRLSLLDYDDMGRVKTKDIGNGLEKQQFTYNIRGQLTGINAGYVSTPTWPDATFGCQLDYDYGFSQPRYDGAIAGMRWRAAGSGSSPRAYGYNYDRAGRMTGADFHQKHTGPVLVGSPLWDNTDVDYSVSGISYDDNGNMQAMVQVGMVPGIATPTIIDNLSYHYSANSNKLNRVEDVINPTFNAGFGLGDFVNRNQNTTDYEYDADGNLSKDNNKNISSIIYNAQDLPVHITSANNGDFVDNIYDASGTLLQKTVFETKNGTTTTKVFRYCGPFVYEDDKLSHVLHEEGRARWLADSLVWRYDFNVKDHLGNVRSTITLDNGNVTRYLATHEPTHIAAEAQIFELGDEEVKPDSPSPSDLKAVLMNGNNPRKRIGTSVLVKVMAGDKFKADVSGFYDSDAIEEGEGTGSSGIIGALTSALAGGVTELGAGEGISDELLGSMFGSAELAAVYEDLKNGVTDPTQPKAYLNWVLFDENMQIIPDQSGVKQLGGANANAWATLEMDNELTAGANGYLVVFMSNESPRDVYMDNLRLTYSRGRLLEEQHYYPHGLAVRGGSSTPLVNRYLYQGKELQDELGLQLYDFHARQYDPQIGRFWGIDPMDQFPSGYTGMGNDPGNQIDPSGCQSYGAGSASIVPESQRNGRTTSEEQWGMTSFGSGAYTNLLDDARWKAGCDGSGGGGAGVGVLPMPQLVNLLGGRGVLLSGPQGGTATGYYKDNGHTFGMAKSADGLISVGMPGITVYAKSNATLASESATAAAYGPSTDLRYTAMAYGVILAPAVFMEVGAGGAFAYTSDQLMAWGARWGTRAAMGATTEAVIADRMAVEDAVAEQQFSSKAIIDVMQTAQYAASQPAVSVPKIQSMVTALQNGVQLPAVKVANGMIIDGHHTYISNLINGSIPNIIQWAAPSYYTPIPWQNVIYSADKW